MRVLRLYHSAMVDEYRERERLLSQRLGDYVHVVTPPAWSEGGQIVRASDDPDVPIHIVPVHGASHPNLFWYDSSQLRNVVRAIQPDIVDLHEEPFSMAAAAALRIVRREAPEARLCIYSAQNLPKRYPPPFSWIERRALRAAAAAYPCSAEAGERLRSRGFRGPIHVIPLGVTVMPRRTRGDTAPRVGFVGRLEPYKGAMVAVRAFSEAARGTDAVFEIIGRGSEEQALRAYAEDNGIGSKVQLLGARSQRETLARISKFDIALVPSLTTRRWKEQFGRTAAQAMAGGAAVIASDSGALRGRRRRWHSRSGGRCPGVCRGIAKPADGPEQAAGRGRAGLRASAAMLILGARRGSRNRHVPRDGGGRVGGIHSP